MFLGRIKKPGDESDAKDIKGSGEDDGMVGDEDRDVMHNLKRVDSDEEYDIQDPKGSQRTNMSKRKQAALEK